MKNVSQRGCPLVCMFQNIADLLGKSLGYRLVVISGLPPLKLVKVDLGICKDRALGTSSHWRCDGSLPWAVKTGRKRQVERVELARTNRNR